MARIFQPWSLLLVFITTFSIVFSVYLHRGIFRSWLPENTLRNPSNEVIVAVTEGSNDAGISLEKPTREDAFATYFKTKNTRFKASTKSTSTFDPNVPKNPSVLSRQEKSSTAQREELQGGVFVHKSWGEVEISKQAPSKPTYISLQDAQHTPVTHQRTSASQAEFQTTKKATYSSQPDAVEAHITDTNPANVPAVLLPTLDQVLDCRNQTKCFQPSLQLQRIFKVAPRPEPV